MSEVFADTDYWIAITDPRDMWHDIAVSAHRKLGAVRMRTTEVVLLEVLNHFCGYGPYWREQALLRAQIVLQNEQVTVTAVDSALFRRGLDLYGSRWDKSYSLTDCVSMLVMRDTGISEVLTHDHHFVQEGFRSLLRDKP